MLSRKPRGVLCDISGVLKNGVQGKDVAIEGSLAAFDRLAASGVPFILCTNESCYSLAELAGNLNQIGFDISPDRMISPISAIIQLIGEEGHRPHVLVNARITPEFDRFDQTNPDIVVVGDAEERFNYETLDETFRLLVGGQRKFYCLGRSKYFMCSGMLKLNLGCFIAGLEYSSQQKAECIGKPDPFFFRQAAKMLEIDPSELVMIGDDVDSDVGGALNTGMQAILVRTGKFRPSDEAHPTVKPSFIADNMSHAIDVILTSMEAAQTNGIQNGIQNGIH